MRLGFDIENAIYRAVKPVLNEISGGIYKGAESVPDNSQKEDVEINVPSNSNGYMQLGYANVNVFAPEFGGERPTKRLKELARILEPLLSSGGNDGVDWQIVSQNAFKDNKRDNIYCVNFKLDIQAL